MNKIELLKYRDFGDLFTITFEFIKQNFKPLFKFMLIYILPFYVLSSIIAAFSMSEMGLSSINVFDPSGLQNFTGMDSAKMVLYQILTYIFTIITYILLYAAVYKYIRFK